ncbi:MAG: PadR family transcriptional regulator [Oscillospiraceae bacterium]|nr:PadR family transcriptional regulator [Oscillospiraceae bacterium]
MSFPLGGALLDGCVLAVLTRGDTYGYALTQNLQRAASISESTLYPVLRRLQKDQYLETYDSPYAGRNRRYYKITADGRQKLTHIQEEWSEFRETINTLLLEEGANEDE